MSFIDVPDEPESAAADREQHGYVPNYSKVFGVRPQVDEAWIGLSGAIRSSMDPRRYELATLAAAQELGSSYCLLAHGQLMLDRYVGPEQLRAILAAPESAELDETDRAVMRLAAKVARDAGSVTQQDVDELRALGLSDGDVMDVVLTAAARCFYSKTLDALGVQADPVYRALDPALRDVLVVGRPIQPGDG